MIEKRKEYARASKRVTSTKRWAILRLKVFERDQWRCVRCGDFRRIECDHIEPVATHPELAFSEANLQTLCRVCHADKTRHEVGFRPISKQRQQWQNFLKEARENA